MPKTHHSEFSGGEIFQSNYFILVCKRVHLSVETEIPWLCGAWVALLAEEFDTIIGAIYPTRMMDTDLPGALSFKYCPSIVYTAASTGMWGNPFCAVWHQNGVVFCFVAVLHEKLDDGWVVVR